MQNLDIVFGYLDNLFPGAECELTYDSPVSLLVATILSAQCTDIRVNMVMPNLMAKYPQAADYANADLAELEQDIRSIGLFRAKAKYIKEACEVIESEFGGEVPDTMERLLSLPGVGRKTANVILSVAFGKPAIVVDTHVLRISKRLGLTRHSEPYKVELDLCEIVPPERQVRFCHQVILFGRRMCKAQKPLCGECELISYCSY